MSATAVGVDHNHIGFFEGEGMRRGQRAGLKTGARKLNAGVIGAGEIVGYDDIGPVRYRLHVVEEV